MKTLRWALFWCHLTAGSLAALLVVALCASGILLAFQPQVLRVVERAARTAPGRPSVPRLGPGTLLRLVSGLAAGASPTAVTLSSDPSASAAVAFGRESVVYLDPTTGVLRGRGSEGWRAFFANVQEFHRWLTLRGEGRELGKAATGAATLAFFGLALSGLFIWWPRLRGVRRVSSVGLLQRGLSGRARDFNWHNVIGVWSALPLLVITLTALPMSYSWANDLVYRIAGGEPPPRQGEESGRARNRSETPRVFSAADAEVLDRLWPAAESRSPGWRSITLRAPADRRSPVVFTIEEGRYLNRFARSSLTLDPKTGAIRKWEPYGGASGGRRARSWMRFLHTGEALGVGGQIAAALSSVGGIFLALTGVSLALRRFVGWRARRARPATPEALSHTRSPGEAELARPKEAVS